MWADYVFACLIGGFILFIPGFFVAYAAKFRGVLALSLSPIISIALMEIIAIAFALLAIPLTGFEFVFILISLAIVMAVATLILTRRISLPIISTSIISEGMMTIVVVGFSSLVALFFFVKTLDGPASFSQGPDNTWHLSLIRSFIDYGYYSSLSTSLYSPDASLATYPVNAGPTFYPAAWHCLAALISSLSHTAVTISVNASLYIMLAVCFPLSVIAFCDSIFKTSSKLFWLCVAVICLGFTAFPWWFLCFGPLYSNFASMCVLPGVAALFIKLFDRSHYRGSPVLLSCFVLGVFSLIFLQTNAVFSLGVALYPYCIYRIWEYCNSCALFANKAALVKTLPCLLFTFVVATLWVTLHDASFMQEIVNYPWPATSSLSQGIINTLTLSYRNVVSQIPLSICLLLGVLYTIIRKKHLWLTAAYIITCIICLNATTSDGVLKSYLSGFWYTDSVRLAANAAILGIPLAALGFSKLLLISDRLLKVCVQNINRNINIFCTGVLLVAFIGVNYYPSFTLYGFADITTAFGDVEDQLTAANNLKYKFDQVLSNSELEFLKQVRDVIPDDALIYNCPDDGSTFAYPIFDLNVYYRRTGYEASNSDGEISATLRTDFVNYSVDNHVQQSVEESGVQYVLLLDIGDDGDDPDGERYFYNHYNSSSWDGLYDIDDSTPGFETVLAEDDMRLYKVL